MVSIFHNVDTAGERLEFSGSSAEDIASAKLFWQSVCLLPHLESGLVLSDASQRRRSAPLPGSTSSTKCTQKEVDTGDLTAFHQRLEDARQADEQKRVDRLMQLRCQDRDRLASQRLHRERLEQKIETHRTQQQSALPPIQNAAAAREAMMNIDEFERRLSAAGHARQRPDTA